MTFIILLDTENEIQSAVSILFHFTVTTVNLF